MKIVHGFTNGFFQFANQTVPEFIGNSTLAESPRAPSLFLTSGEPEEPNYRTNATPQDYEDSTVLDTYDVRLERFYCEEHDCGRGFSSKAHLQSHTRFFHPTKVGDNFTPPSQNNGRYSDSPQKLWNGRKMIPLRRRIPSRWGRTTWNIRLCTFHRHRTTAPPGAAFTHSVPSKPLCPSSRRTNIGIPGTISLRWGIS